MKKRWMLTLLGFVCALKAQTLMSPVIGWVVNGANQVRPIYGVSGNLVPGVPLTDSRILKATIESASFSGSAGILKTSTELLVLDGSGQVVLDFPAPAGPATASFGTDGSLQWFCVGDCQTLRSPAGETLSLSGLGGETAALGPATGGTINVLLSSGGQLWSAVVDSQSGKLNSQVPVPGTPPAVWFQNGWLTTGAEHNLLMMPVNGAEPTTSIAIPGELTALQPAGAQTACIDGRWLLNSSFRISEIPSKALAIHTPNRIKQEDSGSRGVRR